MEKIWQKYCDNHGYEVLVLPIWYYDCDFEGNIGQKHDERELFPEYVAVGDCEKFDFEGLHPDVIVTQVPYDSFSTFMTVHEFFYSSNIVKYTDELIYVPYIEMDAPETLESKAATAISVFVEQPAVINADRIVLRDEKLRDFYVNKLISMTGEDTRNYWEQKVVLIDNTEKEEKENRKRADFTDKRKTDSEWRELLGELYGRKVIIYHVTIAFLLRDKEKSIDKIKRSLKTFEEAGDKICAVIVPQEQIFQYLEGIDKALWQQYLEIMELITKADNCIYDESGIALRHLDKWSGYYGDADPIVMKCVLNNIPVMIENLEI